MARKSAIIFSVAAVLFGCSPSQVSASVGMASARTEIANLVYGDSNCTAMAGDLLLPAKLSKSPDVVLLFHGGGWSSMSRRDVVGVAEFFRNELGFAVFNVDYRLASEKNRWPDCGDDCVRAARWLLSAEFAEKTGIKTGKIWICGLSAGGHLALWTAMSLPPDLVAGAIAISPIGDPGVDYKDHPERYERLLGHDAKSRLHEMDPCRLAVKSGPAILITHSREDKVVRIESSRKFASSYLSAGGKCEMYEYACDLEPNRAGHFIWRSGIKPNKLLSHIERRIMAFVRNVNSRTGN